MTPIGFVAIGRNEGERLVACLRSLRAASDGPIVYVDSGSCDDSVAAARAIDADVVALDMTRPFTAARARNAGLARLRQGAPTIDLVQFIDGDCTLDIGWLHKASAFLDENPEVAAVCGRRRERHPQASLYNRLCDYEWATPIGEALACGGDALMRIGAVETVGAYREDLIAGEEPELCVRLREKGYRIWRLDADMTRHDAAMMRLSQWWRRSERAGHAFAEVSALHADSPHGIWRAETRRALLWSGLAPAAIGLAVLISPFFLALLLAYPAQVARLYFRYRREGEGALARAGLAVLGKFAEAKGALGYYLRRLGGGARTLIEYK